LAKKVENEWRQMHEVLDNIMDFSPTIIFSMTAGGIITSSSRNLESVLQKTGSEIIGRNISEFWPSWPSVQSNSGPGVSDRFSDFELVQLLGREMRTFWVRLIPLAKTAGDGPEVLVLAEDITPRLKQIEVLDNYSARVTRAEADAVKLREQLEAIGKTQENEYLMPVIYEEIGA
jgi:PAS domain-containing protein